MGALVHRAPCIRRVTDLLYLLIKVAQKFGQSKAKYLYNIYSTKRELAKLLCLDSNNYVANFSWIGQLSKWVPVLG